MSYSRVVREVKLKNFKGYRDSGNEIDNTFNVDADLVLVTGKNGVGKTSLLEALDWVLNHRGDGSGKFLNTGSDSGSVVLDGNSYKIEGEGRFDQKSLKSVATFFYQENVDRLACNEVVELLEPENQSASSIKKELKSLQRTLESWQREIQSLKYRRNYDEERKELAFRINQLRADLPERSAIKEMLLESTLTLKNGNLQSRWDSQIVGLSKSLGALSGMSEPVGLELPVQLRHIGLCLRECREEISGSKVGDNGLFVIDEEFAHKVWQLPDDLEIKNLSGNTIDEYEDPQNVLYVNSSKDIHSDELSKLKDRQEWLRFEYRKVARMIASLKGDEDSLDQWIKSFERNVGAWFSAWDNHSDMDFALQIRKDVSVQISSLEEVCSRRVNELRENIAAVENEGEKLSSRIWLSRLYQGVSSAISQNLEKFDIVFQEGVSTGKKLKDFVREIINSNVDGYRMLDQSSTVDSLAALFEKWAALEMDKESDERNIRSPVRIKNSESLVADAYAICKQESGSKSQLLSLVGEIPKDERDRLVQNMNDLLGSFHFPDEFLPISIEDIGTTDKQRVWGFKTKGNVKFEDLSTGQKSQLVICWTINLNLALHEELGHQVIGFDDFTTSLDMNQLIPASVLLRKLAYADDTDSWKRQVIVTSHHEDLTNRLLDFLLPPKGKTMKVIQFEDWSVKTGPIFNCYEVDMGEVGVGDIENAIKRAVSP